MATGPLSNANLLPGAKKIEENATNQANGLVKGQPAGGLTTGQANDLQARYKTLRSQGVSGADATAQIKSGLQASGDYGTMKAQYGTGLPTDTHIQPDFALGTGAQTGGVTNAPTGTPTGTAIGTPTPTGTGTATGAPTGTVSDGVSTIKTGAPTGTATTGTNAPTGYDSKREQAYGSYLSAVSPTAQDQAQIDIAKQELQGLSQGETFAQAYERMRKERGVQGLQDIYSASAQRATDLKSQIQQQAERTYTGSTGITNLSGLINANSRDFARELEHATATMANTATSINAINSDISNALEYRKTDLENKRKSLEDRINALQNKIPQAQLDILKMKLSDSINSISKKEETEAAIAQAKLKDKLENGDINSTDRDLRKKAVLKAINDTVSPYSKYGVTLRVPAEAHAEAILARMEQGQTFEQAFDEDFARPFNSSQSVINAKTQMGGDQNQWKAQMITTEDAEGNKSQQMVFYRTGQDGKLEFVDKAGNPVKVPGDGTGTDYGQGAGTTIPNDPASFISSKEGFRSTPYWDVNGWAIGYGQHSINGRPVKEGDTITREQADADMANRLANMKYKSLVKVPLTPSQEAALSSFEWNLGGGIWNKDAKAIIDGINSGNIADAAELMKKFVNAGGKVNQGLVKRRQEEADMLMNNGEQTTSAPSQDSSMFPSYIAYVESGKLPSGMKEGSTKAKAFQAMAEKGYVEAKNQQFGESGFKISNSQAFSSTSKKIKEDVATAVQNVQPFIDSMDRLINLVKEHGTENPFSEAGKKMAAESKNAQLIAKEIYNLGVLNGPDLSLMEAIIANPTDFGANTLGSFQDYDKLLESGKEKIISNMAAKARSIGLEYTGKTNGVPMSADNETQVNEIMDLYHKTK